MPRSKVCFFLQCAHMWISYQTVSLPVYLDEYRVIIFGRCKKWVTIPKVKPKVLAPCWDVNFFQNCITVNIQFHHSNMVLDVITFQTKDFLCHLSRTTKHLPSGDQKPLGLWPSGLLVTLVQGQKTLSKVFCSLNITQNHGSGK